MVNLYSIYSEEIADILSTFPNQSQINNKCNYKEYYANLTFYEIEPFTYTIDYKTLDNVVQLFDQLVLILFRTPLLVYINHVIDMVKTGPFSPSVLVELQLNWCAVLGLLVFVFVVLILAVLMTVLKSMFAAGKPEDCYQKINPANDYIILFVGAVMMISAIVVMLGSLIGYLGNNQYGQIRAEYGDFAADVKSYVDRYVNNVTEDMKTISDDEFQYLAAKLEGHLHNYHQIAANKTKAAEYKMALAYTQLAADIAISLPDLIMKITDVEEQLDLAWNNSKSVYDSIDSCHAGVTSFCTAIPTECPNSSTVPYYVLDPDTVKPVSSAEFGDYNTTVLSPLTKNLNTVISYNIPLFTLDNIKLWDNTVKDLMDYNKPQRTEMAKNFIGLRDWLKRSISKALLVQNGWKVSLESVLPTHVQEYEAGSTLETTLKYENIVSSLMFSASLLLSVFCCGLFMLGICNRVQGVLPTERSEASQFVAKGMSVTLGVMFMLNLVSMILAITHYVPSTVLSKLCQEVNIEKQNPFQFWDDHKLQDHSILSTAVGDMSSDVTFSDFLAGCKNNTSLFTALNLTNVWDLGKSFNIHNFMDYQRYVINSDLNPHEHWYTSYYTTAQLNTLYLAGNKTHDPTITNKLPGMIPLVANRGLVKLLDTDVLDFKTAVVKAISKIGGNQYKQARANLATCTANVDKWRAANVTVTHAYAKILTAINGTEGLSRGLYTLQTYINNTIRYNKEIFKRSSSTYMITMIEALVVMNEEVECYGQVASHQYSYILGRCRPLYNLYLSTNNFLCGRISKTLGILMLAYLINFVIVTLFSVSISLLIPHFKKMSRLHPEDKLKFEREQIAKADPAPRQDDDKI